MSPLLSLSHVVFSVRAALCGVLLACALAAPAAAQSTDDWRQDDSDAYENHYDGKGEGDFADEYGDDADNETDGGGEADGGGARGRDPKVPYGRQIAAAARRRRVPVALFVALVEQESAFKARAKSRAGARGLTQLMPATARWLGVRRIYDVEENLDGGARYLGQQLRRYKSERLALAAYNAGPGNVQKYRGVPPFAETRHYVKRILARTSHYRRLGVR